MQTKPLNKKILIIEDEISILNGIADKFAFVGFSALKAGNGEEGLVRALKEHPDLILLDYRMPNMDGLTMLSRLREDSWGSGARVIMWSNSHSAGTIERAKKLGVLDFLVKSDWEFKNVVEKVKEVLNMN